MYCLLATNPKLSLFPSLTLHRLYGFLTARDLSSDNRRNRVRRIARHISRRLPSLVERAVHRIAVDSQANGWINRSRKRRMRARRWEGKRRLEAGSRSTPGAAGPGGGGAASQKGGQPGGKRKRGERGRSRRQKGKDGQGDGGAASSSYLGQAAMER
jgi:hypothetical protein